VAVLDGLRTRVHVKNANCLVLICGGTCTGKSWTGLKIGELLDKDFSVSNVVMNAGEFVKLLDSGKLKKGSVVIFDEAGVGVSSREWYKEENRKIIAVLQTFRFLNLIVIFTTPSFSYIDSHARKLFHYYIEGLKIDYRNNWVITKFQEMNYNPKADQANKVKDGIYYKRPRIIKNGKVHLVNRVRFGKPSRELRNAYEKKANLWKKEVIGVLNDFIEARKQKKKKLGNKEIIVQLLEAGKLVSDAEVIARYGIGINSAKMIAKHVAEKLANPSLTDGDIKP